MPDQDTLFRAAWMLLHDKTFLHRHRDINFRVMPLGPLRYLADLTLRNYAEHKTTLTPATLELVLDDDASGLRRHRTEAAMVRRVFRDLESYEVEDEALAPVRELCTTWLARRSTLVRIETAESAIDRGEIAEAQDILRRMERADDREAPVSMLADFAFDAAQSRSRKAQRGAIPIGLRDLDTAWRGGYRRGEIGLVGAPTGVGKSMILCGMAAQAFWKGHRALYYSFELTKAQIKERIRSAILERGKWDIDVEHLDQEWARAKETHEVDTLTGDVLVQEGPLSWPDLREDLNQFRETYGQFPGVLFLDSADDIMPPPGKHRAEWESLKEGYRIMRNLANELRIPIWTSGQLTREAVEKARVNLRQIGGAYAKAQLCHYVLGIAQTDEDKRHPDGPSLRVYVLKDSLHGTAGGWLTATAAFGKGDNGYPGLECRQSFGLPEIMV